jgi:hypothetical protein
MDNPDDWQDWQDQREEGTYNTTDPFAVATTTTTQIVPQLPRTDDQEMEIDTTGLTINSSAQQPDPFANPLPILAHPPPLVANAIQNTFMILPGDMTGDHWHFAAAQILTSNPNAPGILGQAYPFGNRTFHTVVAVCAPLQVNVLDPAEVDRWADFRYGTWQFVVVQAKRVYSWMRLIGLVPIVVRVPMHGGARNHGDQHPYVAWLTKDKLYSLNKRIGMLIWGSDWSFEEAFQEASAHPAWRQAQIDLAKDLAADVFASVNLLPWSDSELVNMHPTTTIVMQMREFFGHDVWYNRIVRGFTKGIETAAATAIQEVDAKITELSNIIDRVIREETQKGRLGRRVVIYNYRIGDVNKQNDSTIPLLRQVQRLAHKCGACVIILPSMKRADWNNQVQPQLNKKQQKWGPDYVFDLHNLGGNAVARPTDKRGIPIFWFKVAKFLQIDNSPGAAQPTVPRFLIGVLGPKSGSVDLAAFMGVRCMSSDEPILDMVPIDPGTNLDMRQLQDKKMIGFGSQVLRLVNMWPIMGICWLVEPCLVRLDKWIPVLNEDDFKIENWLRMDYHASHQEQWLAALPQIQRPEDTVRFVS